MENNTEITDEMLERWEYLPDEMICEILNRITKVDDLFNYIKSSERIAKVVKNCVLELEETDSYGTYFVNASDLIHLKKIKHLGKNIIVLVDPNNYHVLRQLPDLLSVNILCVGDANANLDENNGGSLESLLIPILEALNVENKIPHLNLRIMEFSYYSVGFFLQGNQYAITPSFITDNKYSINRNIRIPLNKAMPFFSETLDKMRYFNIKISSANYNLGFVSEDFINFVSESDFGLLNPSTPSSDMNPPLLNLIRPVIEAGLIKHTSQYNLILIYAHYNGLIQQDGKILLDEALLKLFRTRIPIHADGQRYYVNIYSRDPKRLAKNPEGATNIYHTFDYINRINDISKFNIPKPARRRDKDAAWDYIKSALDVYSALEAKYGNAERTAPFYKSDDTFAQYARI